MPNLIKNEFYKLRRSKLFYFSIILALLQNVVIYAFSEHLKIAGGKETLTYMLFIQGSLALDIIIGAFAADFIVSEFYYGYIKNLIAYGHKRILIFISKTIAFETATIIISFICPIAMTIINTARNGYGEVFTYSSLVSLIGLLLLMMLIQIAVGSIYVLAAFASRNTYITVAIVIGVDFINRVLNVIFVRNKSIEWIIDKLILSQPGIISSDKVAALDYIQAAAVAVITILICVSAGIYAFNKADIK